MEPIKFKGMNKTYAKHQPEYIPLPVCREDDGKVTSVWELTDDERKMIADGAKVCLCQSTFNQPLQPVNLWVDYVVSEEEKQVRSCRVCGCTEINCNQCVEATGEPCHWVEQDLCSRCQKETAK